MIPIHEGLTIPDEELEWSYARSGGPGGQNVNKVSSKAILRWSVARSCVAIPLSAWTRMKARFPSRFTVDGEVLVSSQKYRDQERNRLDCEEKLAEMVRESLVEPTPRKASKPSRSARRRRVDDKRRLSEKKQSRRSGASEE